MGCTHNASLLKVAEMPSVFMSAWQNTERERSLIFCYLLNKLGQLLGSIFKYSSEEIIILYEERKASS